MNKQIMLLTLCLVTVLISLSACSAANVYVNTTGNDTSGDGSASNPFQSVAMGVGSATDGDTVIIADGTYSGASDAQIDVNTNMIIQGQSQEGTIINGSGNWIFQIHDGSNVTIQRLTFINAGFNDNGYMGTAIYVERYGSATVNDCTFKDNNAGYSNGGAIGNDGSLTVNRCTFTNNQAASGGAIYHCDGTMILNNCTFGNNQAASGGAIYTDSDLLAPTIVNNCIFDSNTASIVEGGGGYGGAIYNDYEATITGCNFNKNTAGYRGGAIYTREDLTVKYSRFVGNSAGDLGEDIYSDYGHLENAALNWWGSNAGPAADRVIIQDTTPADIKLLCTPWLVMNILPADPSTIYTGQTSKITVNVYKDSNGGDHSADASQFFSGPEVKFTTNLGNVGSKEVIVPWTLGMAFAILRGDEGPGVATVTAADGEIKSTTVTILQAPTVNAASNTVGMQETGLPIAGLILAILTVFGGLLVPKRK